MSQPRSRGAAASTGSWCRQDHQPSGNPWTRTTSGPSRTTGVEDARAHWRLVFYCRRNVLMLSAATAATVDAILAIAEGRSPHTLDELTTLLSQL
jgi:hypothetical protein